MRKKDTRKDFEELRDGEKGKKRIKERLERQEKDFDEYLAPWLALSKEAKWVYPSQGLLQTPYDELKYRSLQLLPQETLIQTLRLRLFFLEMFNHPYRMTFLDKVNREKFQAPAKIESKMFDSARDSGLTLSIGDIAASVVGAERQRISRKERYAAGPFVKLGRAGRTPFVGSASPDVWNSALAIATMAASHCLAAIPRNGITADLKRQSDLAQEVFERLKNLEEFLLAGRPDRKIIAARWRGNVMGVVEPVLEKALVRSEALYKKGVRSFRVYSPEPGSTIVKTVAGLRKEFKNEIEIFAGQIVEVDQAKLCQEAGAEGLFVGIGGGGRCITGVRSGSVIDWPDLVWRLRGEIEIPVIVEGGASDHVAVTFLLGASGIGVSRIVAGGTIESPGGALFCADSEGKLFKPYGGEASARTKFLDGKLLPFGIASFVEGETTKAEMSYVQGVLPTLTYNLHLLIEDAILAIVFRAVENMTQLQAINPSPLTQITSSGEFQRRTH